MQKFILLPNLLRKIKISFYFFVLLFIIHFLLFIPFARAADYQCSPEKSPEYHSLRPYPGDPCNKSLENLSYSCGNTMVIKDTISVLPDSASSCITAFGSNTETCTFSISRSIDISVDTSKSTLPIAGLTDGDFVVNSEKQPNPEKIDNETKMSEYMSWYLSGIPNKAEYSSEEDVNKSVDLAGPIKKLLPWLIQDKDRQETVNQAGNTRHNQVIGCLDSFNQVVACYPQRPGVREIRLTNWKGNLSSSYIPFSSTEDLKGEISLSKPGNAGGSITVKNEDITFTGTPATLYFSHMQEGSDLADVLQPTYKARDLDNGSMSDIQSPKFEPGCKILEVRSNEGDKLLGGTALGTLTYNASFECTFNLKNPAACVKQAIFASEINVSSPEADNLWTKLVSGTSGIVRRIFPKLNSGGLGSLIDMPAVTTAAYSSGAEETSPTNADIYIPHLGGVSEYFLKGVQTMLRPKGFGETIAFGPPLSSDGEVDCDKNAPDVSLKGTLSKTEYAQRVLVHNGNVAGDHALECYNDVVRKAREAGVNPAFALVIWYKESGASNYNRYPGVEDFGAHGLGTFIGFNQQIQEFLRRAKDYTVNDARCNWNIIPANMKDNMHVFAWIYRSGRCDPNYPLPDSSEAEKVANDYYVILSDTWKNISPGCPFPNSPTDTSCPQ